MSKSLPEGDGLSLCPRAGFQEVCRALLIAELESRYAPTVTGKMRGRTSLPAAIRCPPERRLHGHDQARVRQCRGFSGDDDDSPGNPLNDSAHGASELAKPEPDAAMRTPETGRRFDSGEWLWQTSIQTRQ